MSIDVASIDMVSEVNMVSELNMFAPILPQTLPLFFFFNFPPYLCIMGCRDWWAGFPGSSKTHLIGYAGSVAACQL